MCAKESKLSNFDKISLLIDSKTYTSCGGRVEGTLSDVMGVHEANVNLRYQSVRVLCSSLLVIPAYVPCWRKD